MFEHEEDEMMATSIEVTTSASASVAAAISENEKNNTTGAAGGDSDTKLEVAWGTAESTQESPYKSFLKGSEKILFSGPTWKRKGLFSKFRVLIFTDAPRLLYIDPAANEVKGEIPWTKEQPVKPSETL